MLPDYGNQHNWSGTAELRGLDLLSGCSHPCGNRHSSLVLFRAHSSLVAVVTTHTCMCTCNGIERVIKG
jgi:hypothetical protein